MLLPLCCLTSLACIIVQQKEPEPPITTPEKQKSTKSIQSKSVKRQVVGQGKECKGKGDQVGQAKGKKAAMEGIGKLGYAQDKVANVESDIGYLVKHTLDTGINDGADTTAILNFKIPADHEHYTDLNSIYMKISLQLMRANGDAIGNDDEVFLDPLGIQSLFSSCDVTFNDEIVSSMTRYPFTSKLLRYFGSSFDVRENVWDSMDGSWSQPMNTSAIAYSVAAGMTFTQQRNPFAQSAIVTLYGRVNADVFTSARQFLPPGISIGVELRRGRSHFSLISSKTTNRNYFAKMVTASVYARRYSIKAAPKLPDNPHLIFNRLETKIQSIPKDTTVWSWRDCLNGAALPNRIYLGFVTQQSLHGHLNHVGTYFEPLNLNSLNLKVDGKDVLVEPVRVEFGRSTDNSQTNINDSKDKEGFLTIMETLGLVSNQNQALRLKYLEWQKGMTVYAIELGKCGEMESTTGKSLDIDLTFSGTGTYASSCAMLFTEKTQTLALNPKRRL